MNLKSHLHIKRLGLCIRNDFLTGQQTGRIAFLTVIIILFLWRLIFGATQADHPYLSIYVVLLFVGGFWTTSKAFTNLHDAHKGFAMLMVPASHLEKLLSRLLLTSVGYILLSLITYTLFYALMHYISMLIFSHTIAFFNPLDPLLWNYIAIYCVTQSMVLLASLYFRTHPLLKLVLCITCFLLFFNIFIILLAYILFHRFFFSFFIIPNLHAIALPGMAILSSAIHFIFWFILAPLCWILSYMRLAESEI